MEERENEAVWRNIEDNRRSTGRVRRRVAGLEERVNSVEGKVAETNTLITDLNKELRGLRDDIRGGQASIRTLLWIGGVVGGIITFATWAWIEIKKAGGL